MSSPQSKLAGVQYMRALASCMVLIGHVIAEAEHYLKVDMGLGVIPWTRGVDIFFVISGFIIMVSAQKYFERPQGVAQFLRNRFTRVVPLYWFFTTLMLAVLLIMPGAAKDTQLDWGQVVTSYLFIPYERYDGRAAPILSLGWTLNFEIFFYALFALALFMPKRIGPMVIVCAMAVWVALGAIADFGPAVLRVWSNPLILEFCFGVLLGHVYVHHWSGAQGRNRTAAVLLVMGFGLLMALNTIPEMPRWIASGLPVTIMVGAVVFFWHQRSITGPLSRLGLLLGDSSYALYLSHRFALRALTLVLLPMLSASQVSGWIFVTVAVTVAVAASIVVFYLIERPMLAVFKRRPANLRTV